MAARLPDQNFRPNSRICVSSKRLTTPNPAGISFPPFKLLRHGRIGSKTNQDLKWAVKLSLVDQNPSTKSTVDTKRLVDFLYEDLPHLFDDQGIDPTMYDESVKFRDPITKHDSISGYLFNIKLLKKLFTPEFQLHSVKQVFLFSLSLSLKFSFEFYIILFGIKVLE